MSGFNSSGQQPLAGPSGSGEARMMPGQQFSAYPSTTTMSQSSNADALSAIHMPFDFGDVQFTPTSSMQQQHSVSTSAAALADDGTARAPPKARKRKTAQEGDGASGSRGGGSGGRGSRGGRGGRGGSSSGGARKASKTQAQLQEYQEQQEGGAQTPATFGAFDDSASTSRAASLAPSTPAGGTGPSTPTKRGGGRGGGGGGRGSRGGGRGAGRGRGSRGRGRPGSRQTSVRTATASVAPGGGAGREDSATAAPEGIGADEDGTGGGGGGGIGDEDGNVNEGGEDESSDDENVEQGLEEDEMARQELIQRDRSMRMAPLMKAMTEEQMDRYSAFRRSYLDKRFVRRLVAHLTRQTVTPQVATLVAGVGKVFIGEIVERARHIRQQRSGRQANVADDDTTALRPEFLIEALQQYRQDREVPGRFAVSAPNFNAGLGGNGQRRHLF